MNSKTPYLSIVTASYNSENTIADTIESVLAQNFKDFEYIIIDGNSSDSTLSIIKSYEQRFKEENITFKYISEKDKGIYDAWNKGITVSSGHWISFLGSDDTYLPDALDLYYSHICNISGINYISSRVEVIDKKGQKIRIIGKPFVWSKIIRDMDIAQVGSFHKRELFEKVGMFSLNYSIVGDLDFYIRSKNLIKPFFFPAITAKMLNSGVSNNVYTALRQALQVKLDRKQPSKAVAYFHFYYSLGKCLIRILLNKI